MAKRIREKKEKAVKQEKVKKKKSSAAYDGTLFGFVKVFFTDPVTYSGLKQYDKAKNRFMINRFMSIQYPVMANRLNKNGTSAANVVDSWYIIAQRYTRVPMWIYTKLNKQTKVNNVTYEPDPEALKIYLNKYQVSQRDFKQALKFNADAVMKEIQYIEKQIKVNE
jgi:hypothetical protein